MGHDGLQVRWSGVFVLPERGLTLRSSGLAPAWHLAREALWYIIRLAGQAPRRRSPLSSNVRQHTETTMVLAVAAGAAVATKDQMHSQRTSEPDRTRQCGLARAPRLEHLRSTCHRNALRGHQALPPAPPRPASPLGRRSAAACAYGQRSWPRQREHRLFKFVTLARLGPVSRPKACVSSVFAAAMRATSSAA